MFHCFTSPFAAHFEPSPQWKPLLLNLRGDFESLRKDDLSLKAVLYQRPAITKETKADSDKRGDPHISEVRGLKIIGGGAHITGLPYGEHSSDEQVNLEHQGAVRRIDLFGEYHDGQRFQKCAKRAGIVLASLPQFIQSEIWKSLPIYANIRKVDYLTWIESLFEIAWQRRPGIPIFAERTGWGDPASFFSIEGRWHPKILDRLNLKPSDLLNWFSVLEDLPQASIDAIDLLCSLPEPATSEKPPQNEDETKKPAGEAKSGGSEGDTSPVKRRKGIPLEEANIRVREWLEANAKDDPKGITREAVHDGTGVSTGQVSNTSAWKAFDARRKAESKPGERKVPLTESMLATIPADCDQPSELGVLIDAQEKERAQDERRRPRRHAPS